MNELLNETALSESEVINIFQRNVESQFPKDCPACSFRFCSPKDYLLNTTLIGKPRSYDDEMPSGLRYKPLGIFSFAKCKNCGNTLTTTTSNIDIVTMQQLLMWLRKESLSREESIGDLLNDLRTTVANQFLDKEGS